MCDICSTDKRDNNKFTKCRILYNDNILREVLLHNILQHPNIPTIDNVGVGYDCYGHEYIHYDTNRLVPLNIYYEKIKNDTITKWKFYRDIVGAVTYLSYNCIHHQNIKPSSILIDTKNKTAYLSNYGFAGDKFTLCGIWVDPNISEYFYTNIKSPSSSTMIGGNIWSLGLLGVWLFIDPEIYMCSCEEDCMDLVYFSKGRFGSGLRKANLNLNKVDDELVDILDRMMSNDLIEKIRVLKYVNPVTDKELEKWDERISTVKYILAEFNKMSFTEQRGYILDIYGIKSKPNLHLEEYIETIKKTKLTDLHESISVITDILDTVEKISEICNKIKLVYLLYDYVIPKCYYYINSIRFWTVCINKLKQLTDQNKHMKDLYDRNIDKLKQIKIMYSQ